MTPFQFTNCPFCKYKLKQTGVDGHPQSECNNCTKSFRETDELATFGILLSAKGPKAYFYIYYAFNEVEVHVAAQKLTFPAETFPLWNEFQIKQKIKTYLTFL